MMAYYAVSVQYHISPEEWRAWERGLRWGDGKPVRTSQLAKLLNITDQSIYAYRKKGVSAYSKVLRFAMAAISAGLAEWNESPEEEQEKRMEIGKRAYTEMLTELNGKFTVAMKPWDKMSYEERDKWMKGQTARRWLIAVGG